ncbi:membrane protein insertion efficiency factor YidD [Rhodoblastus acidophilus]|uniref:Putative membrane protein insertion efficiency factor n=1 Tax=Candidatus Rhodoblastus alkanivorans TaxID=2954117 RepID=A0ABS9Z8R1_9HYPH|nr:membrane protein insertion efficiency factor YidD [Candidatus Rhodoblastus alkanivorans]MCI4677931.1 membrane protein insertion efficiency factor YidD [Candidatus Rhodoblastus alkanivorans]MCI4683826.1 membrane protein insertion efficiency factor YidD [Candidatus Rhodoblastus alkanivorans]MDI4641144.1 membrane protein insertion efficiency factor YidD [Rhodoblastus acidophilus]
MPKNASVLTKTPALLARGLIQLYRVTLSSVAGRNCRYLPTCSAYMDDAIARHGLWGGGWMGFARICRCHPLGDSGFDPVPPSLPRGADALHPWRYGSWRKRPVCEAVEQEDGKEGGA